MSEHLGHDVRAHFEAAIGNPPPGSANRVLAGFRAAAGDQQPGHRVRWAAGAVALVVAVAAIGLLTLVRHSVHGPVPARSVPPRAGPSPRSEAAIVFDKATGSLLMFGGTADRRTALAETWTWSDGSGWAAVRPSVSPPGRFHATVAYDEVRKEVVLYGGRQGAVELHDTWTWNGRTWTRHADAPIPLSDTAVAAFDPISRSILLYEVPLAGGPSQTWTWNGTEWQQLHPHNSPVSSGGMASDGGRLVLFSGGTTEGGQFVSQTWAWDGTDWTRLNPTTRLPGSYFSPGAYDESRGLLVVVLESVDSQSEETWTWDGLAWKREHPAHQPPGRTGAAVVYDSTRKQVLTVGGDLIGGGPVAAVWAWDGSDWRLVAGSDESTSTPATRPTPIATDAPGLARAIATVGAVNPKLAPALVPAGMSGRVTLNPDGYLLVYTDDTHARTLTIAVGVIGNPPPVFPSGRTSPIRFRGVTAQYVVYDAGSPLSQRRLEWTEPGMWTSQYASPKINGIPYSISASGLSESEFLSVANSLTPAT